MAKRKTVKELEKDIDFQLKNLENYMEYNFDIVYTLFKYALAHFILFLLFAFIILVKLII
jgi:hypothetical protein